MNAPTLVKFGVNSKTKINNWDNNQAIRSRLKMFVHGSTYVGRCELM